MTDKVCFNCQDQVIKWNEFCLDVYRKQENLFQSQISSHQTQEIIISEPNIKERRPRSKSKTKSMLPDMTEQNEPTSPDYMCKICGKLCDDDVTFEIHSYYHLPPPESKACEFCGKKFFDNHTLKVHLRYVHEIGVECGNFWCDYCGMEFTNKDRMAQHMKRKHIERNNTKAQCPFCGKLTSTTTALRKHIKVIHGNIQRVNCPICEKSLAGYHYLRVHLKTHDDKTLSHCCSYCGKGFRRRQALMEHETLHNGQELPYKCDFCNKKFRNNTNMYTHRMKLHPKEYNEMKRKKELQKLGIIE